MTSSKFISKATVFTPHPLQRIYRPLREVRQLCLPWGSRVGVILGSKVCSWKDGHVGNRLFVLQKSSVYGVKRDFIVSSLIMVVRNEETRSVLACILLIVHTVGIFGQSPTTAGQRHLSACQETQKSLWVLVGASFWHMRKIIVKEREWSSIHFLPPDFWPWVIDLSCTLWLVSFRTGK